jgi:hypothetical protein
VGVEDEVAPVVLDFWSGYVSAIAEEQFQHPPGDDGPPEWMEGAKSNVLQVISELVQKIIYPPNDVTESWDADAKKTFKVFRMDVRDIIAEAYESLRDVLTDQFYRLQLARPGNKQLV